MRAAAAQLESIPLPEALVPRLRALLCRSKTVPIAVEQQSPRLILVGSAIQAVPRGPQATSHRKRSERRSLWPRDGSLDKPEYMTGSRLGDHLAGSSG